MFTIIYHPHSHITVTHKPGDEIARHAADAFGFMVLDTPDRRSRHFTGPQFADAIAAVMDPDQPNNAAVIDHLRNHA